MTAQERQAIESAKTIKIDGVAIIDITVLDIRNAALLRDDTDFYLFHEPLPPADLYLWAIHTIKNGAFRPLNK